MSVAVPKIEVQPLVPLPGRSFVVVRAHQEEEFFVASCEELGVFTQGATLDELRRNVREAVDLSLAEGEHVEYGLPPSPAIWFMYEESL
jgi:predicted RNase H-like HicB family nuclease